MVITSILVAGHAPGQLALALVPLDGDWKPRGLKRFASSGDVIGVVLAGWRHETNRLSP
jgi:hypothetical protein